MTDQSKEPAGETPMRRALRLKQQAQASRPADKARFRRDVAAQPAGAAKPWMKR